MRKLVLVTTMLLGCVLPGWAQLQEPVRPEETQDEVDPRDVNVKRTPEAASSVTDRITRGSKNRFGLTAGAYEAYSTNLYNTGLNDTGGAITFLSSQVFTNFGNRRTRFHADYGLGYRMYTTSDRSDAADHQGMLTLDTKLTNAVTWSLYNSVSSMRNDYISYMGPVVPGAGSPTSPDRVYVGEYVLQPQRTFHNNAATALAFQLGRSTMFKVTGGYQTVRYNLAREFNQNAFYGAAALSHRFSKWLSFSSSYTRYFAQSTRYFRDTQIQQLRVGELEFNLSRRWVARCAGGLEYAKYVSTHLTGGADASLTHTSEKNRFQLSYRRGFTTLFGLPGVFMMNTGSIWFVQSLSRIVSFELRGDYQRGTYYENSGNLDFYDAAAALQVGLRHDLVASLNLAYRKQVTKRLSYGIWDFDRYIAYVGLQYFWSTGQ
jgi:hypothetical protein